MIQIDTRPQQVGTATAYRENSLPLVVVVLPEINLEGVVVAVELQANTGKKLYAVTTFSVIDQNIVINFTKAQVKAMPNIAYCLIILDGVYQFGYKIEALFGFGIPSGTVATIGLNLKGDKGDPGDLTAEAQALKDLMTEDRQAVASDKAEVSADAMATEQGRAQTVTLAGQVAEDKGIVGNLKIDVVNLKADTNTIKTDTIAIRGQTQAIYDQVLEAQMEIDESKRIRVTTYAAMVALLILNKVRKYRVLADETQINEETGIPEPYVLYTWDGEILYMYDIYPKNPQPVLN